MGIEGKHSYRFGFLKSEKWQTVRIEALAREGGRCQLCAEYSISNDAHHIRYPDNIWQTSVDDLVIVCRPCHDLIHLLLEVHGVKEHSHSQFTRLAIGFRDWKHQKEKWLEAKNPNRADPEELSELYNKCCQTCKRFLYPIESRPAVNPEKYVAPKKLIIKMCSDCFDDLERAITDNPPDETKKFYKAFREWRKKRENQFKAEPKQ